VKFPRQYAERPQHTEIRLHVCVGSISSHDYGYGQRKQSAP
jgi:hypothetical protein